MYFPSKQYIGNTGNNSIARGVKAGVRVVISIILINCGAFLAASPLETLWTVTGTIQDAGFGQSISSAGDINGDGFDDVIIAQVGGPDSSGQALVYYGSAAGLPSEPGTRLASPPGVFNFARIVEEAGDINGDGFADVMMVGYSPHGEHTFYIYYGSAGGLVTSSYWTPTVQESFETARQLSTAGDVNNDGYSDIVVTANKTGNVQADAVWIFNGSPGGPASASDTIITFPSDYNRRDSITISAAGDINNDGFDDIVAGFMGYSQSESESGRIQIHYGSPAGISFTPSLVINGIHSRSTLRLGPSLGDYNNDGFADVRLDDNHNGKRLYYGSAVGLSQNSVEVPTFPRMISAGDVDGDDNADILVADPLYSKTEGHEGIVYLHYGTAGPVLWENPWVSVGTVGDGYLGDRLSTAGDVNGDGYDDIMVSETGYPAGLSRVHVYYGAARDSKVHDWTLF